MALVANRWLPQDTVAYGYTDIDHSSSLRLRYDIISPRIKAMTFYDESALATLLSCMRPTEDVLWYIQIRDLDI